MLNKGNKIIFHSENINENKDHYHTNNYYVQCIYLIKTFFSYLESLKFIWVNETAQFTFKLARGVLCQSF